MCDMSLKGIQPRDVRRILLVQNPDSGYQVPDGNHVTHADVDFSIHCPPMSPL